MQKIKLLKSVLIPILGISAIGAIAVVSTSCEEKKPAVVPVTSVELNKTSTTLAVGDTEQLTATVLPVDATDKSVTWTSSNPSVATVKDRVIIAVSEGIATITVTTNDGGKTATCKVTVNDVVVHVQSVELDKASTTLAVGKKENLIATVLPETATDKSVTWTSSNTDVATVNSNGTITAKVAGTATITSTSVDNPNAKATCAVNVNNSPYVVIIANTDSILTLRNNGGNNPNLQYSTNGTNWDTYSTSININQGQSLYLKGNNSNGWSYSSVAYSALFITGDVSIAGNVMGLLDNGAETGEQGDITAIPCDSCFYNLFQSSTGIKSISDGFLPATDLTVGCYNGMFVNCTSLLTTMHELPAQNLTTNCYYGMFQNCTSLAIAPNLRATALALQCCYGMFSGCSSLTTAPKLPATVLANYCYSYMFLNCSSLTTAPKLPATSLANSCYYQIFTECTSLNSIKIGYTGNYDSTYFNNWVYKIASSGTFYYNGSQTPQNFGFPSGWTKSPF